MVTTECEKMLASLSDYIDGEVPSTLMQELEEHLKNCPNCRIVLNTTRKTIELYHDHASDQQPSTAAVDRLYRTLNLEDYLPEMKSNG